MKKHEKISSNIETLQKKEVKRGELLKLFFKRYGHYLLEGAIVPALLCGIAIGILYILYEIVYFISQYISSLLGVSECIVMLFVFFFLLLIIIPVVPAIAAVVNHVEGENENVKNHVEGEKEDV